MRSDYDDYRDRPPDSGGGRSVLIVLGVLGGLVVVCGGVIFVCIAAIVTLGQNASGTFSFQTSVSATAEVGQVAPEIEGEDLDGQRFKLSEYKGKVVVLDFWGNW